MPGEGESPQLIRVIGDAVDDAAKANSAAGADPGTKAPHRYADGAAQPGAPGAGAAGGGYPQAEGPGTFYVYVDATGTEHLVNSLDSVPKKFQATARRFAMDEGATDAALDGQLSEGLSNIAKHVETVARPSGPETSGDGFTLHVPSLLIGMVGASVLFIGSLLLRRRTSWLVKGVLAVVAAAIASVAYLGWVRRQAGLGDEAVSRPSAVLEDARRAADRLRERNAEQQRRLEQIDAQPEEPVFP